MWRICWREAPTTKTRQKKNEVGIELEIRSAYFAWRNRRLMVSLFHHERSEICKVHQLSIFLEKNVPSACERKAEKQTKQVRAKAEGLLARVEAHARPSRVGDVLRREQTPGMRRRKSLGISRSH